MHTTYVYVLVHIKTYNCTEKYYEKRIVIWNGKENLYWQLDEKIEYER